MLGSRYDDREKSWGLHPCSESGRGPVPDLKNLHDHAHHIPKAAAEHANMSHGAKRRSLLGVTLPDCHALVGETTGKPAGDECLSKRANLTERASAMMTRQCLRAS